MRGKAVLRRNDVIEVKDDQVRRIRVLWLDPDGSKLMAIDVDDGVALPVVMERLAIDGMLGSGEAQLLPDASLPVFAPEDSIKPSHKRRRDAAWRLVQELVETEPQIYTARYRGKEVARVVARMRASDDESVNKATKRRVYQALRRYWQRGMTKNALLPDYRNSGAPGKTREPGEKKRGRPRKYGTSQGINITQSIRRVFQVGFDRFYASKRERTWSLRDAFDRIVADFFTEKHIDPETGQVVHVPTEETTQRGGLPTIDQFRYWVEKDNVRLEIKRRRVGARAYDLNMRGLPGTSNSEVMGPGDRYQIDATIADVYLVSRMDRKRIIGRPVLYVVVDVFSRMVVGLYVGLEGPSWVGAMMALANTASDKVRFCAGHGISIEHEDWPCSALPGVVFGDRGEIESRVIDTLINNFNVSVENAAAYRADWKGIVERRFRLLPEKFRPFVPGYVHRDFKARGGRDYRLDAALSLDEFTQIIIECILHYNNHHEISRYDKDRDVRADGVPGIPMLLWEWGRQHRSGVMREYPEEPVRYALLPRGNARVTERGILFRSGLYACPLAMEERWFDKARQEGGWRVQVAYDPRCLDSIYLEGREAGTSFHVCSLTTHSRALRQLSSWEVDQQEQLEKHARADRREDQQMARASLAASIEARVEAAKARQVPSGESAASRTRAIRDNRAGEKQANREDEAFRLGQATHAQGEGAEVVNFPGTSPDDQGPDYSMPSLDEILGEDDGD